MAGQSRTLKLSILGDIDQLKKSLATGTKEVDGFAGKLGGFAKKAGAAFAVAGAAAAAYAGKLLIDGVKSAVADEAAQAKLATTLKNVTGVTNTQIKAIEDQILKTSLLTGRTDDELRPSLDRLVRSTKNVEQAQKLQALALDISAGSGKSLEAVSNALAKSAEGQNTALGKLGVGISQAELKTLSFEQITAKLSKTFEDQASVQADTFEGKMLRLNVAFDEAKETVGSYVLDALTPLISGFVNKGIPAITDFANKLGQTLGPAFSSIFKVIRDDLLPILTKWWEFLYKEVIPAIASVVGPILTGLKNAFDSVRNAIKNNSAELQPFYDLLEIVWDFIKKYLAPLLGGAFKTALEAIGSIVAGLVTGFSRLVGFITSTINKIKEFVNFVKDNPVTRFFFGDSNDKSLKAGVGFDAGTPVETPSGGGGFGGGGGVFAPSPDSPTFTGAPLEAYSPAMQAAILRREELKAETERLRQAREDKAAARAAATGGLSTADRINIIVNAPSVIDEEGFSRAVVDALNNSTYRGTNGATNFVSA
jgi:phage-related protein